MQLHRQCTQDSPVPGMNVHFNAQVQRLNTAQLLTCCEGHGKFLIMSMPFVLPPHKEKQG